MRIVVADCHVEYHGRLASFLPDAKRLLMVKADGSVLVHADGGAYKPLNWMSPPCQLREKTAGETIIWECVNKQGEELIITLTHIYADFSHDLGSDPGLIKDGVEAHLQKLLAEQTRQILGADVELIGREYMTPIGPVDLLCRDSKGCVAVEVKRRGEIDGVEQLTRYLELLNRDPLLAPVRGIFAAQSIKLQARTLAQDRGITCVTLDYEAMHGADDGHLRLF